MAKWFNGNLETLLAVALLGSAVACGDARPVVAQQNSALCARCHGDPPETNAHVAHTSSGTVFAHAQLACNQCHRDVQRIDGPDHILDSEGKPVGRVEVRFDDPESIAARTQQGATRATAVGYDATTQTCSNVYCHGAGLKGSTAAVPASIAWTAAAGSVTCGTCHGLPPADHGPGITLANCTTCHGDAIDADGKPSATKHVNGTVDLAPAVTTSCTACHGDASAANVPPGDPRAAPPRDAEGQTASSAIGAHQNHVFAGVLGKAVACGECHVVPASLLAPGHLDGAVTVTFGALAKRGGLSPDYNPKTQTCSNVYCHGLPGGRTTAAPAPTWNGGTAAVGCGSCHGLPPPQPLHPVVDVVSQGCNTSTNPAVTCHPAPGAGKPGYSFDPATGLGTVDPKLHIDGRSCPPDCN